MASGLESSVDYPLPPEWVAELERYLFLLAWGLMMVGALAYPLSWLGRTGIELLATLGFMGAYSIRVRYRRLRYNRSRFGLLLGLMGGAMVVFAGVGEMLSPGSLVSPLLSSPESSRVEALFLLACGINVLLYSLFGRWRLDADSIEAAAHVPPDPVAIDPSSPYRPPEAPLDP